MNVIIVPRPIGVDVAKRAEAERVALTALIGESRASGRADS